MVPFGPLEPLAAAVGVRRNDGEGATIRRPGQMEPSSWERQLDELLLRVREQLIAATRQRHAEDEQAKASRKAVRRRELLSGLEQLRKEHRGEAVIYVDDAAGEHPGHAVSCGGCGVNFTLSSRYPAASRKLESALPSKKVSPSVLGRSSIALIVGIYAGVTFALDVVFGLIDQTAGACWPVSCRVVANSLQIVRGLLSKPYGMPKGLHSHQADAPLGAMPSLFYEGTDLSCQVRSRAGKPFQLLASHREGYEDGLPWLTKLVVP